MLYKGPRFSETPYLSGEGRFRPLHVLKRPKTHSGAHTSSTRKTLKSLHATRPDSTDLEPLLLPSP